MVKNRALYYSRRRKSDALVLRNREETSILWSGWMLRRLVESIFRNIQAHRPGYSFHPENTHTTGVNFYERLWDNFSTNVPVGAVNVPTLISDWKHIDVYARYLHVGQVGTNGNYIYGSGIVSAIPLRRGWYNFYLQTLSSTTRLFVEYYRPDAMEQPDVSEHAMESLDDYVSALPAFAVDSETALPAREPAWVSNLDC